MAINYVRNMTISNWSIDDLQALDSIIMTTINDVRLTSVNKSVQPNVIIKFDNQILRMYNCSTHPRVISRDSFKNQGLIVDDMIIVRNSGNNSYMDNCTIYINSNTINEFLDELDNEDNNNNNDNAIISSAETLPIISANETYPVIKEKFLITLIHHGTYDVVNLDLVLGEDRFNNKLFAFNNRTYDVTDVADRAALANLIQLNSNDVKVIYEILSSALMDQHLIRRIMLYIRLGYNKVVISNKLVDVE